MAYDCLALYQRLNHSSHLFPGPNDWPIERIPAAKSFTWDLLVQIFKWAPGLRITAAAAMRHSVFNAIDGTGKMLAPGVPVPRLAK